METQTIVITNVDSLTGYAIAYYFLTEWNQRNLLSNRPTTEFRLLCHDKQGLHELEKLGGQIIEMKKFDNEKKMRHVMKDVYYVILIPEHSSERLQEGENVIQAAKKEGVEYLTMLSYLGLNKIEDAPNQKNMKNLHQFVKLEKIVTDNFDQEHYCFVRSAIFHQFFYYFGPMIDDENQISLTIDEESKWGSIDLNDLIEAIFNISIDDSYCNFKNQTVFEFTAEKNINAKKLIQYANEGLERENMTYKRIDSKKMYNYLHRIHKDNRFRERPNQSLMNDQLLVGKDRFYTFPLGRYLNRDCIETLIEYLDLINSNCTEITTDHLKKALHDRSPQSLDYFFKKNKHQFQRLR